MTKIYYSYIPAKLDVRGYYQPNHVITDDVAKILYGKAEVYDESNTSILTPNTIRNFGYVELLDSTIENQVLDLLDGFNVVSAKQITVEQARQMLRDNNYTETVTGTFEITPAGTDMDGTEIPATYLEIV